MEFKSDKVPFVDEPIPEVYSDVIGLCVFDGSIARLEFWVNRIQLEPPQNTKIKSITQHPVARIALSPQALIALAALADNVRQAIGKK